MLFFLAGCSGSNNYHAPAGGEDAADVSVAHDADGGAAADVAAAHGTDSTAADAGIADAGRARDSAGGSDAAVNPPVTPIAPEADHFIDVRCPFPASITYDRGRDALFLACGGDPNALFHSPPLGAVAGGEWRRVGDVEGIPANHVQLSEDEYAVAYSSPDGIALINVVTGGIESSRFSDVAIEGAPDVPPSFPTGMAALSGALCVAMSNFNPADFTYRGGANVVCFPRGAGGQVNLHEAAAFETSGKNATGMTVIDDASSTFAVLSSNSFAPETDEEAALDVFQWPDMEKATVPLGGVTAQIAPSLAVTAGGLVLVGVQSPAAAILGVDIGSGSVAMDRALTAATGFPASVQAWGDIALVSDFGVFGERGHVLYANTDPNGWQEILVTDLDGTAGPAVIAGQTLYQSVTKPAGGSAVYAIDLSMF